MLCIIYCLKSFIAFSRFVSILQFFLSNFCVSFSPHLFRRPNPKEGAPHLRGRAEGLLFDRGDDHHGVRIYLSAEYKTRVLLHALVHHCCIEGFEQKMSSSVIFAILIVVGVSLTFHCDATDEVRELTRHHRRRLQQELCSCSPRSYSFKFMFNEECGSSPSTLSPNEAIGISNVNCQITIAGSSTDLPTENLISQIRTIFDRQILSQTANTTVSYISSILFIEFDTSGTLTLINENATHLVDANFTEGMTIAYPSISQLLDPSLELEEQMQYVPGGAGLFMFANNDDGDLILSSKVVWEFTGACNVTVDIQRSTLGWVSIVSCLFLRLGSLFL